MTDTITTWQERDYIVNDDESRHEAMQNEIDELRAALAQQAEQVPATYQFRMKTDWMNNWAEWVACNKDQHEMYLRSPKLHDWNYETRALYAAPQVAQQAEQGWQPIESAPKDAVILLGLPLIGNIIEGDRRVYEGRWHQEQKTWTSVNGIILLTVATHWAQLPIPPAAPPKEKK